MLFIFVSQLKQAEAALKAEDEEIEEVRQEFTVRVTATEKKYQAAAKVSWCCSRAGYPFPSHIPVCSAPAYFHFRFHGVVLELGIHSPPTSQFVQLQCIFISGFMVLF